jgi:molybdate transport system permease protein
MEEIGLPLTFTWRGAVLAAAVVGLPLVIQSSKAALEAVDSNLIDVARTLGRSELAIFLTVGLPLSWRGVLSGSILAFARALGEFGATLMVASNIPGKTQTLPIAIYDAVQSGDQARANLLSLLLTATAILLLILIRRFGAGLAGEGRDG